MPTRVWITVLVALLTTGCAAPNIKLFSDASFPLQEYTLQGRGTDKVLLLNVRGVISSAPREKTLRTYPSMVEEIVSQLRLARTDPNIRAILLKIESPGGSTVATDILYHEIMAHKAATNVKLVAALMGLATSGAYYVALPADAIVAHPTTVTGSVGVVFARPQLSGLMEKIGVRVDTATSGRHKDMGSPFRAPSADEERIFQEITDGLGRRFVDLVAHHRRLAAEALRDAATARVYLAPEALRMGLVDRIGYLDDAVAQACQMAALPADARVVTYRRSQYPNDTLYNPLTTRFAGEERTLMGLVGLPEGLAALPTGFYYLWPPAAGTP